MLSRVANSIYWMCRYLERSDNVARFVKVNSHLMLDLGLDNEIARWEALVYASGDHEDFFKRYKVAREEDVLRFLTFDAKNPNSILSCVYKARENARSIRENLPSELWESVNELYHTTKRHSRKRRIDALQDFLREIQSLGYLINGYSLDAMERGEAWHFARAGRLLERSDKTARLIDIKYFFMSTQASKGSSEFDSLEWGALLKSVNASEMYRKRYHVSSPTNVAQFLVFDPHIPRSIAYCINAASASIDAILGSGQDAVRDEMSRLAELLKTTNADALLKDGLHEFIDRFQVRLNGVDEVINARFFS